MVVARCAWPFGWALRLLCSGLLSSLLAACATWNVSAPGTQVSHALGAAAAAPAPLATRLGSRYGTWAAAHPGLSGFRLISNGADGLLLRLAMIDAADRTLDLQYYVFHADASGQLVAAALLRAADRGVHVRLLLDDGDRARGDEDLLSLAAHPAIEVRVFNPFVYRGGNRLLRAAEFLIRKSSLDRRMHNKLFVADGVLAIAGGRNIGDQYFQVDPRSQFGDDDVLSAGPIVPEMAQEYATYWNSGHAIPAQRIDPGAVGPARLARLRAAVEDRRRSLAVSGGDLGRLAAADGAAAVLQQPPPMDWAAARLLYDSPDKERVLEGAAPGRLIYPAISAEMASVRSRLSIMSPFLVPTPAELRTLQQVADRAVSVRLLTNSLEAAPNLLAQAGYMRQRRKLLRAGLGLFEIRARLGSSAGSGETRKMIRSGNFALHGKLYIFDALAVFIGSMNLDQRSARLNTEMGLIIRSQDLARQTARRFDELTMPDDAYHVVLGSGPNAGAGDLLWETEVDGRHVTYTIEPARSAWQRFKAHLCEWLPLEREL